MGCNFDNYENIFHENCYVINHNKLNVHLALKPCGRVAIRMWVRNEFIWEFKTFILVASAGKKIEIL